MTPSILHLVLLLTCTLTWQGGATIHQDPSIAVLGPADVAFARGLHEAGYGDLALGLCRAIEAAPAEAAEHAAARAFHLDLRLDGARREQDTAARKAQVLAVLADKQAFVRDLAGTPEAQATHDSLPDVYQFLAETLVLALEHEPSPDAIARLREEGAAILRRAADATRARIEELAQGSDDLEKPAGRQLLSARYSLPRILWFHSRLHPEGTAIRNDLLTSAIDRFQELELDYSDTLVGYEAQIHCALCYRDLAKTDLALERLDAAIALREQYSRRGTAGGWILPPEALDIIAAAVTQKVILLRDGHQTAAMAATVADYHETIENAWDAPRAAGMLGVLGDAQLARSDSTGVRRTIEHLRDVSRRQRNRWAEWKARDLGATLLDPARGSATDPAAILRAAQHRHGQGATDAALRLCRAVLAAVRGTGLADTVGANGWMLLAAVHGQRGMLHEAAVAYEALIQECPAADLVPEALWRAAACYVDINAREPSPFYTRRIQERIDLLVTRYPDREPAQKAALLRARQLEAKRDYAGAHADYRRVPEGAPGHEEARYRAGACLVRWVTALVQAGRPDEATAKARMAEIELREAMALLERRAGQTLDPRVADGMSAMAFGARVWLADLFLAKGVDRAGEVESLLASVDQRTLAADPERRAVVWRLRIQALVSQDRLDDAVGLHHSARLQSGDPRSLRDAARILARALDTRGVAQLGGRSPHTTDETWRKAAALYRDSVADTGAASAEELEEVGTRLLVIGLHLARIPESQSSFIGWKETARDPERILDQSVRMLSAAADRSPMGTTLLKLGQAQAWLRRFPEAARTYGKLFDGLAFVDEARGRLDRELLAARPALLVAWLEWGACEHEVAHATNDSARYARCLRIFQVVIDSMSADTRAWWTAKHELITTLIDRGEYQLADVACRDVLRTQDPAVMARHGHAEAFARLARVLADKVQR